MREIKEHSVFYKTEVFIGTCSVKKMLFLARLFLHVTVYSQAILPEIRAGSFSQKVRCSGTRDVLSTGALHRTTNCSIEHFDLGKGKGCPFKRGKPRFCKYLPVSVH